MPAIGKLSVMACLFVMIFIAVPCTQAQGTGKDMTIRGPIAGVTPAKDDARKKAGLVGWIFLKQPPGPGLRAFVREKTKLEKMVGKERQPATFRDLETGATVEVIYVLHDGQPSAGPTLADARRILVLPKPR